MFMVISSWCIRLFERCFLHYKLSKLSDFKDMSCHVGFEVIDVEKNCLIILRAHVYWQVNTTRHGILMLMMIKNETWNYVFLYQFLCSPQTDKDKDPDYDSLPSQTSQSESSMLQVICRPEATSKEEAYTFHTVHSKSSGAKWSQWEAYVKDGTESKMMGSMFWNNCRNVARVEKTVKMVGLRV